MQLLGERTFNDSEPATVRDGQAFAAGGHQMKSGRIKSGRRRGARVRAGGFSARLRRRSRSTWDSEALPLPEPLLTAPMAIDDAHLTAGRLTAARIPTQRGAAGQDRVDTVTDATSAAAVAAAVAATILRGADQGREDAEDELSEDTAEWEPDRIRLALEPVRAIEPVAIDLSDGPKLIEHPEPPVRRPSPSGQDTTEEPAPPAIPKPAPPKPGPPKPGPPKPAPPLPVNLMPPISAGSTQVPDPVQLATEPSQLPEALLATVLSVVAALTAWGTSAGAGVWLPLAAIPAVGLVALLLPGTSSARVLRAGAVLCVAATLPVMSASMTPVTLVIALAVAATYPMLIEPAAGRLVTLLATGSLLIPLLVEALQDGPGQFVRFLLEADPGPGPAVKLALGSGILVVTLIGSSAAAARRTLDATASVALARDRTARATAAALGVAAECDAATGLPNRTALLRATTLAIDGCPSRPGLIQIDLDRFELLTGSLGAARADDVADQVGRRLRMAHPADQVVARIGRHQFALLVPDATEDVCTRTVHRITALLETPISAGGHEVSVTCSMGAALHGPDLQNADDVLQAADEAVRAAARTGCSRWMMFEPAVRERSHDQAMLELDLREAIRDGSIEVAFQPVLALGAGDVDDRIVGAEVLARWTRTDGSPVEPKQFIPLADELGLGVVLGMQVINRALGALVIWRHEGVSVDQVWVNLSPTQLEDPEFAHEVAAQLAIRGLAASSLVLEVSATGLCESEQALATMGLLRSLGIAVALDNFGRSGTSLAMLRRLPISAVKFDRTLVGELGRQDDLPGAVANLCRTLGLRVVIEGVETVTQLHGAREIQADAVQGFAIARPMSGEDITNLLTLRLPRDFRLH